MIAGLERGVVSRWEVAQAIGSRHLLLDIPGRDEHQVSPVVRGEHLAPEALRALDPAAIPPLDARHGVTLPESAREGPARQGAQLSLRGRQEWPARCQATAVPGAARRTFRTRSDSARRGR